MKRCQKGRVVAKVSDLLPYKNSKLKTQKLKNSKTQKLKNSNNPPSTPLRIRQSDNPTINQSTNPEPFYQCYYIVRMEFVLNNRGTKLFLVLAGFFVTNALVAEFVGVKIFSVEKTLGFTPFNWTILGIEGLGLNMSAGSILWPVVFVMTDVINEYFGKRGVRILSYFTVLLILYAFFMIFFAIQLFPEEWWQTISGTDTDNPAASLPNMQLAFSKIFGQGLWIIVGSIIAFLVGQIVDVMVFHRIRKWTGEKKIWLRATGSTLVSQFIDSFVVLFIAFYIGCLLYTSPSPRDATLSRMPSSA